jgi:hypothetical protein
VSEQQGAAAGGGREPRPKKQSSLTPKASLLSRQMLALKPLMQQRRPRASCKSVSRTGVECSSSSSGGATSMPPANWAAERNVLSVRI